MAEITNWVKKIWKNRTTEFPTRRTLMKEDGSSEIVTVTRNEGTVSEEGDAFDADTMNNLEERIDAGFAEVNGKLGDKTLGVITDISSFIGSNYIIPSDGYIRLIPTSTSSPIGLTDIRNNTTLIEAHYITSIFVRKGITLKIDGSGRIGFIPLINK